MLREKKRDEDKKKTDDTVTTKEDEKQTVLSKPSVITASERVPSPALVLSLPASPGLSPRSDNVTPRQAKTEPHTARSNVSRASSALPPVSPVSNPIMTPVSPTNEAEDRLDTLIKSLQKGEVKASSHADTISKLLSSSLPNNQAPVLPAKPLPADSYKNNLLKAKHDEESRADQKNSELNTSREINSMNRYCSKLAQQKILHAQNIAHKRTFH